MEVEPSNYVTIHELKQRWLQQQKQQIPNQDSESNPKPTIDSASKTLATDHPKVDNHDYGIASSKDSRPRKPSQPEPVEEKKQHRTRNRKPKYKTKMPPVDPQNDDSVVGVVVAVAAPVKEQHQPEGWSRDKKVFRPKTTPSDAAGNDDGVVSVAAVTGPLKLQRGRGRSRKPKQESKTPPFAPQNDDAGDGVGVGVDAGDVVIAAHVKEQAGRWSRKKKVLPPKTPPFDAAGDADDGLVEVEAVAVTDSVTEINVCNVSHTKEGYGRFHGGSEQRTWSKSNRYSKPPSRGKKGQMSQVWVKKGESAPN